jgi:hypothetical protein
MTADDQQRIERETLERAIAVVQKYQNEHWRRARVNAICSEIKLLLSLELKRTPSPHSLSGSCDTGHRTVRQGY